VLGIGGENQVPEPLLTLDVRDGPQQREAPALAVHAVGPSREGDVATAAPAFPHTEANQLHAFQRPAGEMQLGVRELARGLFRSLGTILTFIEASFALCAMRPTGCAFDTIEAGTVAGCAVAVFRGVRAPCTCPGVPLSFPNYCEGRAMWMRWD
jgi:hypothetical protein